MKTSISAFLIVLTVRLFGQTCANHAPCMTIADLRALSGLTNGTLIDILGETTIGDSPLRLYRWDASSTVTENAPYVIDPTASGNGRFFLQHPWIDKADWNQSDTSANSYIKNKPTIPTIASRSFTNNAIQTTAAAGNGNGNQLSSTRDAQVNYSVTIVTTATIGGASSGTLVLEIAATNSSTAGDWQEVSRFTNGQSITLAVALQSVQTIAGTVSAIVPAGYYRRIRSINNSGSPSFTVNSGQEVLQ